MSNGVQNPVAKGSLEKLLNYIAVLEEAVGYAGTFLGNVEFEQQTRPLLFEHEETGYAQDCLRERLYTVSTWWPERSNK